MLRNPTAGSELTVDTRRRSIGFGDNLKEICKNGELIFLGPNSLPAAILISIFLKYSHCAALLLVLRQRFQAIYAIIHRKTYRMLPSSRQVLVLGGSFAGTSVARRLANTLPSGYTVTLLEKHSHFHYAFAFPRFSVVGGLESKAFVPYNGIAVGAPKGILQLVQGEAKSVNFNEKQVDLVDGRSIPYEYLVVATGAAQPPPTRLRSVSRPDAIEELQSFQQQIKSAQNIAVIGGGAAGIQLVADIKDTYPDKKVTLIHSRDHLLPRFGSKLHEYVFEQLKKLGINVLLNERPNIPSPRNFKQNDDGKARNVLTLADGSQQSFDLILPCTGLRPNSGMFLPGASRCLAPNGEILVGKTLQIQNIASGADSNASSVFHDGHYFALGDIAHTGGPKQARAALFQAEIVVQNILKLISGNSTLKTYTPIPLEGSLKLTLGKVNEVIYARLPSFEFLQPATQHGNDVGCSEMWKRLNAREDMEEEGKEKMKITAEL
ncbi:hypothetical protein B7463_g11476, partial [Scytalidium lignicola]